MSGSSTRRARLRAWLDERVGLSDLGRIARKKQVPLHRHTLWYYLGGMTLFLLGVQVVTGILLLFYYRPSAEHAYESIRFVMAEVEFGWLIRSIHAWSANLMILTAFVHFFSVLLLKAYRAPRELTWVSGVGLLGAALGFGFTGYLLPWSELSYFATRVGTEMMSAVPGIGAFLGRLLKGGEEVTGATLTRFYALHVAVLPALTLGLLALHLFLVQKHGMSVPPGVERRAALRGSVPFFPDFLLRDLVGWLSALALLAALSAYYPAELGEKADPFASAPAGIRPEWYFVFMFQTLKYLPAEVAGVPGEAVGVLGFIVGGAFVLLIPFLDRSGARGESSRLWTGVGLALLGYLVALTALGYASSPTK